MHGSSLTHVFPSSSRDFLVTPGRMEPSRGGVAISGSAGKHKGVDNSPERGSMALMSCM